MINNFNSLTPKLKPYENHLIVIFSVIVALFVRFQGIDFKSSDYTLCLEPWYNHIIENGGFAALKDGFYNYNPPYMYLMVLATYIFKNLPTIWAIKLINIPFDFLGAFWGYKIVNLKYPKTKKPLLAFIIILFVPTVIFNSAYWGQCDMIYTSFLLASLYCILTRKPAWAVAAWSIALAFKLQAMFFAPVLFILWLKGYLKWYLFILVPVLNFLALLPVIIAGRNWVETLMIYFNQSQSDVYLTILAPTVYQWISNDYFHIFVPLGMIFTATLVLIGSFILYRKKFRLTKEIIVLIALISVLIVPFFLPKMHERYFYATDVISILFAFYYSRFFWIPILISFSSLVSYYPAHKGHEIIKISYCSFIILCIIITLVFLLSRVINKQQKQNLLLADFQQDLNYEQDLSANETY